MHYFVHAHKVTTDSSADQGKESQPLENCLMWHVAQPLYKTQKFLNTVLRLTIPGGNEGRFYIFKKRTNKRFAQGEETTRGHGREGSL